MCLPTSNTMPATKSHAKRAWIFSPLSRTLVITQGRKADTYAIEEQPQERTSDRVFILCHQGSGEVYEVRVMASGFTTCSGQWCGRGAACKHRDSVMGLLADEQI